MRMRGIIEEFVDGNVIVLPCVSPDLPHGWPPSERAREVWTASFVRRIEREGNPDALPAAVAWEWREEHPYVLAFLAEVVNAAIDRHTDRKVGWREVEHWTEQDFIERVRMDVEGGGTGGYRSVARRTEGWLPTALLRRWQKVSGGKPWPSHPEKRTSRTTSGA